VGGIELRVRRALGTSSAPLGIAFDVIGGAAVVTGAGLLIWRATSAKVAR
jgi:hypothetical protein